MLLEREQTTARMDFEAFYRHEYARLVRALLLLVRDPTDAEDLAQEALSRVFERWDQVRQMQSPQGYLYRTALNLNRKRIRRMLVHARRAAFLRPPEQPDLSPIDDRVTVRAAVLSLPRGQREALVLVELIQLETTEAAQILGIAPASVRSRLMDARRNLRVRLEGPDA
jgi:RNA polymerase sigma factor (sigma-70 family)